jgi:Amt family ammonium transporter
VVCFGGVLVKSRFGYDDALDAFGVHGVGGALGALLTGVFAAKAWGAPADGLIGGGLGVFGTQALGVAVACLYSAAVSFALLKLIDATLGLRVSKDEEREGLDAVLHGESGYELDQISGGAVADDERSQVEAARVVPAVSAKTEALA